MTIEGETWAIEITKEELAAWDIYAENHTYLVNQMYERTLRMFLSHFRRGINLNLKL